MPRLPLIDQQTSPFAAFRLATLNLPPPTEASQAVPAFGALTQAGARLADVELAIRQQREELDTLRLAGDYDLRLAEKERELLNNPNLTTNARRAELTAASNQLQQELTSGQESSPVKYAVANHVARAFPRRKISFLADSLKVDVERNVVDGLQAGERGVDIAAAAPYAEGDVRRTQAQLPIDRLYEQGSIGPEQYQKAKDALDDRYWSLFAQRHPTQFLAMTEPGQEPPSRMDQGRLHHYRELAHWEEAGMRAKEKEVAARAKLQLEQEQENTRQAFLPRIEKGDLLPTDIINSNLPAVGQGSKEHFLNVIHARAEELSKVKEFKHDPTYAAEVLRRIRSKGEDRITSEDQIDQFYFNSMRDQRGVNFEDLKWLREEFQQQRTPDGRRLSDEQENFLHGIKPSIDKSNPMMGQIDQDGQLKYSEFVKLVRDKVAAARKAGQDPHALFDPESPEYLGKAVAPYQKTLMESIRDLSDRMRKQAAPPKAEGPSELQRKPGESIEQYLKRKGQ